MDCSLSGSSVYRVFQARILDWVTISFSRGSSQPRDWTHVSSVSCMADRFFTHLTIGNRAINKYLNNIFNEEGDVHMISNYFGQTQTGKYSTKQMAQNPNKVLGSLKSWKDWHRPSKCDMTFWNRPTPVLRGFPGSSAGKEFTCNARDLGLIPAYRRSPGGGHGRPCQYSCLENHMDREPWRATVHGFAESDTTEWLSTGFLVLKNDIRTMGEI